MKSLSPILSLCAVRDWLFPRRCAVCGRSLRTTEQMVCTRCWAQMPFTGFHGKAGNGIERIFWGKVPIVRANALLRYQSGNSTSHPVLALKYRDRPAFGRLLGRMMAEDLTDSDFFQNIDLIVPVPLARRKERRRGYNQSEMLARGVADVTGLPIDTTVLARTVDNPTQTRMSAAQRRENVRAIFRLLSAERVEGRHVLLVDDVVTSGATLLACAEELSRAKGVSVSVLTAYAAGRHPEGVAKTSTP